MEQQILQAVEIALSGTADAQLKQQAYDFIEQIKTTPDGYRSCVDILIKNGDSINEQFKFFIYQVIDENISRLSAAELYALSETLFTFLKTNLNKSPLQVPVYLKNKFAGTLATLFCHTYLEIRPSFIKDLLQLSEESVELTDYYVRVILAVHSEIGDKFISRSKEYQDRNTNLKDSIRINDMNSLVSNWKKILQNPSQTATSDILNNTLKVVGSYIEWMEITLFISDSTFINCIFQYLTQPNQRIETCSTLIEIISKKMPAQNKLELLALLNLTSVINSILLDNDDLDFSENVAKLVNQIGIELVIVLEQNNPNLETGISQQIMTIWPFIFNFLEHEYDDVTQQVFPFISQFLLVCKRFPQLVPVELLGTLLNKIILKMRFEEDDDGREDEGSSDEDLEQFLEIRLKLKNFQDTIAVLKPDLYLEAITTVINESLFIELKDSSNWRKLELGLYELSNFADSLRNNLINLPKLQITSLGPFMLFQEFVIKLINSNFIISVDHPKIQLGFFELIVRQYSFLNNSIELTMRILEIFTSPLGLFNQVEKVRLRSWYLFFRFIKLTKPTVNNSSFIENTLIKVQPILEVKAILPIKDEDDDIVESGNFNNQLYLFESIGLLISLLETSQGQDLKLKFIDIIFQPLFNGLEKCITESQAGNSTPLVTLQAHHLLMAIGTFARGYDYDYNNKYSLDIVSKINNAATIVLVTLENFVKYEKIRDASRFAFARFIPILGKEINNHLSKLVSLILSSNDLKYTELSDFLSFLGQIVHNFNADDNIYQLVNDLLTPLFDKVFQMIKFNGENNEFDNIPDMIRDRNSLKKSFMNLLSTIILNHNTSLFVSQTNKHKFPEVLGNLFEYGYDLSDPTVSRLAVLQLVNFITVMASGRINDPLDKFGVTLGPIEGIEDYLMNKSISLSFELPFQRQEFDIKDAQFRIIGQEIATLLKTYQKTRGDDFLAVLSTYLTNMGLSQELMNAFGTNLVSMDQREFKNTLSPLLVN